jgi:hypothetical protein
MPEMLPVLGRHLDGLSVATAGLGGMADDERAMSAELSMPICLSIFVFISRALTLGFLPPTTHWQDLDGLYCPSLTFSQVSQHRSSINCCDMASCLLDSHSLLALAVHSV